MADRITVAAPNGNKFFVESWDVLIDMLKAVIRDERVEQKYRYEAAVYLDDIMEQLKSCED